VEAQEAGLPLSKHPVQHQGVEVDVQQEIVMRP
jgi:hypothetical protein